MRTTGHERQYAEDEHHRSGVWELRPRGRADGAARRSRGTPSSPQSPSDTHGRVRRLHAGAAFQANRACHPGCARLYDLLIDGPYVGGARRQCGEWRGSRNQRLFSNPAAVLADRRVQACIGTAAEWLRQSCAATAANVGARRRTLRPAAALRIAEVRPLDPPPFCPVPRTDAICFRQ